MNSAAPSAPPASPAAGWIQMSSNGSFAQQPAVGDAIQRHAAGQHQVSHFGLLVDVAAHPEDDLFGDRLDARRQVHVPLLDVAFGIPGRAAEQIVEPPVGHRQPLAVVEVVHVQPEAAIRLQVDQVLVDGIGVDRCAVRREPHQLVLAAVDLEAAVVGEGRVEQPERMRETAGGASARSCCRGRCPRPSSSIPRRRRASVSRLRQTDSGRTRWRHGSRGGP